MADDPQTLAAMVRAKYPGAYDNLSDADLEAKVKEKYPGVYDAIPLSSATKTPPEAGSSSDAFGQGMTMDALKGVGAGVASTVFHGGDLIRRGLGMERVINKPEVQAAMTAPPSLSGAVGKAGEQIGEFFLPGGAIGRTAKALETGSKVANVGIRALLEGASAAGITTAQTGSPSAGATSGAVTAGVTAGLAPAGKLLKPLGEKIEDVLVKAKAADYADGFKVSNIFKHGLGGTLEQTYNKTQSKIDDLVQRTKQAISASPAVSNINQVFAEARQRIGSDPARSFGSNTALNAALDKLELDPFVQAVKKAGGDMNLAVMQKLKLAMGDMGAWLHDPTGRTIADPDAKAMEQVANTLYDVFKKQIEQKAIGPVKAYNALLSELIPIRRAIIRRLPVEARNSMLHLSDITALSHGHVGLAILNRAMRSGRVANALVGASAAEGAAPLTGRVAGALTSQAEQEP